MEDLLAGPAQPLPIRPRFSARGFWVTREPYRFLRGLNSTFHKEKTHERAKDMD
jgi:hypothetical protein